ncbi:hypothetical protein [Leuconostoc suionicum]|uniref:hypothetical protein n=1 Tax=Leuconostoc suionicum TaxID=1511761 RepID=UPI00300CD992
MKYSKKIIIVTIGLIVIAVLGAGVGKVWADNNSWQGSPNLTRTRTIIDQLGQKVTAKSNEAKKLQEQTNTVQMLLCQ